MMSLYCSKMTQKFKFKERFFFFLLRNFCQFWRSRLFYFESSHFRVRKVVIGRAHNSVTGLNSSFRLIKAISRKKIKKKKREDRNDCDGVRNAKYYKRRPNRFSRRFCNDFSRAENKKKKKQNKGRTRITTMF